jgi:tricorn protease-like protein
MGERRITVDDLRSRLREIEGYAPPDLWEEIAKGGPRLPSPEPGPGRRPVVVALALLIALGGVVLVARAFGGLNREPTAEPAATVENGLIAFAGEVPSDLYAGETQSEIFVIAPDGTMRTQLTDDPEAFDDDPAWSPDGTRIAFIKLGDLTAPGIYVMKADGSGPRWILEDATGPTSPSWSPDGTKIVFETGLGQEATGSGDRDIYAVEVSTGRVTRLTNDPARDEYPALSPDGSRIAFTRQRQGDADIHVMNADGSGVRQLTSGEGIDLRPAWSPNGTKITFERDGDIYVITADGSGVTRLTEGPSEDRDPAWAPDGALISFVRDGDIFILDADGDNMTNLTHDAAGYSSLSWQAVRSSPRGERSIHLGWRIEAWRNRGEIV